MTEDEDYQMWREQNLHDAAEAFAGLDNTGWSREEYDQFLYDWDIDPNDDSVFWELYDQVG